MKRLFFLSGILLAFNVQAELKMPKIFSDNMVLQRDIPAPVWGWADPGEKVTVQFKAQEKSAIADADGKWMVRLDHLSASAQPEKLTIAGKNDRKEFRNVLVGDVWLCSGQSNMEVNFSEIPQEAEGIDYPQIRLGRAGNWQPCNSANLQSCSRVGYYFGLKLWQELRIPIGLVNVAVGCSAIEAWMPPENFAANDNWKDNLVEMEKMRKVEQEYKNYTNDEKERLFIEHCRSKYGEFAKGYLVNGKPVLEKYGNILWHMTVVKSAGLPKNESPTGAWAQKAAPGLEILPSAASRSVCRLGKAVCWKLLENQGVARCRTLGGILRPALILAIISRKENAHKQTVL